MSYIVDAVEVLFVLLVVHVLTLASDDLQRARLVEERTRLSASTKALGYYRTTEIESRESYR